MSIVIKEIQLMAESTVNKNKKCGIIMPISEDKNNTAYTSKHWKDVLRMIKESIDKTEFEPSPVWDDSSSDQIKSTIYNNIISHDIIVCDISSLNANVMFELGLRLSIRKPVVIICDDITKPPFDINDIRYVTPAYPVGLGIYDIPDFQNSLVETIKNTWNRFLNDEENYTQLLQLSSVRNYTVVDKNSKEVQYGEAIAKILMCIEDLGKKTLEGESKDSFIYSQESTVITANILAVQDEKKELLKDFEEFSKTINVCIADDNAKEATQEFMVKLESFFGIVNELISSVEESLNVQEKDSEQF